MARERFLYVRRLWWDSVLVDGPSAAAGQSGLPEPSGIEPERDSRFRAFLFADIRGFTRFTDTRGADAAAALTARFVALAGEVAAAHRGVVTGTWGDQVLVEFRSARDAVRAAAELQRTCRAATVAQPAEPMGVGIGLDIGEPASNGELLAGDALNLAARLCAAAKTGEVLASNELVHFAGTVDGVEREPRGRLRVKGFAQPLPVVRIVPTDRNAADERAFRAATVDHGARRRRHRLWLVATLLAVAVAAGATAWFLAKPDNVVAGSTVIPAQALGAVNASSGRLIGTARLKQSPESVAASPDGRDVWVAEPADNAVVRIDARTRQKIQTVYVGAGPVALVVVGHYVWVANSLDGTVTEISAQTNAPVGEPVQVGTYPSAIAYGLGWLWITNEGDGTLTRVKPDDPRLAQTVDVGTAPDGVAVGDAAVWVANRDDNTVIPVDPTTMQTESLVRVGAGPQGIMAAAGRIWVADSLEQTVTVIDQRTLAPHTIIVGDTPTALAAGSGAVWVSDAGDATVSRIDSRTERVTRRYVTSSPHGLAMIGSTLWVAGQPFASPAHRGGTLVLAGPNNFLDASDPQGSYSGWPILHLVYDGLVTWNRAPGGAGYELVPDLAITLPVPTADGMTYTFTLRPGIRYSDGRSLRASDFRRGIERMFMPFVRQLNLPNYYDGIVGATACVKRPDRCDLTRGIVTDDATGTVTFHLVTPDPDFVSKLAIQEWAAPVPPGTPPRAVAPRPVPGTGPYVISRFDPDRSSHGQVVHHGSVTLVRNRRFHQWSVAAQPAGYPQVIRSIFAPTSQAAVSAVEHGRADVTFPDPALIDLPALTRTYPTQVHAGPAPFTGFVVLNAAVPPFNNPIARRAVAHALIADPGLVRIYPGSRPACRLVPVNWPGYSSGCPYQRDLALAKRLVIASGTRDARVNVFSNSVWIFGAWGRYVTSVLRQIGYDAHLTLQSNAQYNYSLYNPRTRPMNVEGLQWYPDFLAASQYYAPLLSCATGTATFGSCNPRIDALAKKASALQTSDPGAATRIWQEVYRQVDADARLIANNTPSGATAFVSARVGNFRPLAYAIGQPDLDQLWVR